MAQKSAWNEGEGCINATEYNYALTNAIAPLCKQWNTKEFAGWCRCGCFEKGTEILSISRSNSSLDYVAVEELGRDDSLVFAMTNDSTSYDFLWQAKELIATTAGTENKPLYVIHLANGVRLGLTGEHAVLIQDGSLIPARELDIAAHNLVDADGNSIEIVEIARTSTSDKVYNVLTDGGPNHKEHLIVANGIVVGDIMWQNTLAADLNKIVIRM